ncbi:MAG: HlyC/CorC family transporter [Candidatus Zixiibacteriota bacterium]|nr:MAG: HlyC/CorC family transporter [candidate division Zixibacteria bacterium]
MKLIHKITHPILGFLNRLLRYAPRRKGAAEEGNGEMFPEEIESLTEGGENELEEEERQMIHGVVELGETQVKEIMRPRPDMICISGNAAPDQVKELVEKHGHSRIPVYDQSIDSITGIIYVKDLFLLPAGQGKTVKLSSLARKAYFVPETKKVDELLKEFKRDKVHMAIVVDEYGGTAGLVTLEDVIEEIVGEIQDEYDKELPPIQKLDEKTYRVDAGVSMEDLNETLGTRIEEKGFETVGGFIYDLVGSVPEQGKKLEHRFEECALRLLVEKVEGQRIKTVKITVTSPSKIPPNKPSQDE